MQISRRLLRICSRYLVCILPSYVQLIWKIFGVARNFFRTRIWKKRNLLFLKRAKRDPWRQKSKYRHGGRMPLVYFFAPQEMCSIPYFEEKNFLRARVEENFFEKTFCFFGLKNQFFQKNQILMFWARVVKNF